MLIGNGRVAIIDYTLKDDDGDVLDASQNGEFIYLHGAQNIIPGLEVALEGKQAGDSVSVSIEPKDAYGERDPERIQVVPRDMFETDDEIVAGMQFHAQSPEGNMMVITVAEVDDDEVTIDGNHAMAGMNLHFSVDVVEVREATAEELEHGHVHSADGCGHDH
ncbi:MAG: peptidylprolyl isomerase [Gammaproteobacteria bacterium]|nr:peptidylprolyl isomerase [Gammaproteobacteria bacterium]